MPYVLRYIKACCSREIIWRNASCTLSLVMASSVNTGAMDALKSTNKTLQLRYHVHRGKREIFWAVKDGFKQWDAIYASVAHRAIGARHDGVPPEFIGSRTQKATDHTPDAGLSSVTIALDHALQMIHSALQDEPGGVKVRVSINSDNIIGLRLIRQAVRNGGLGYYITKSGSPRMYHKTLEESFILHQKIEHLVGRNRVEIVYRFLGGNVRPCLDHNIVLAKCNEILDQMQDEYYASRRWNKVSRFVLPFDCHGWLKGDCRQGFEKCPYRHRPLMWATKIPDPPQHQTNRDEALAQMVVCRYWAQGKCFKGDSCTFAHEGVGGVHERPVCIYWKQGNCFNGDVCEFRHHENVPKARLDCVEIDLSARLQNVEIGGKNKEDGELT